jgi:hypothetical protein
MSEEKNETKPLEIVKPEITEQLQQQQLTIKKIYKAVFAAYRINCDCETCKIMKEVGAEIEKLI